ncbi:MAG: hypothetical protein KAH22_05785 [Thiotrichaceae bacterium]|nr:hypothetical protein [Thiotrichaceae bacterium]
MELDTSAQPEDSEFIPLDLGEMEEIEEIDFSDDTSIVDLFDEQDTQREKKKNAARRNIEEIMEARALRRELADLFDDDLLVD